MLMSIQINILVVKAYKFLLSVQKKMMNFVQNADCKSMEYMVLYKRRKGESNVQVNKNRSS